MKVNGNKGKPKSKEHRENMRLAALARHKRARDNVALINKLKGKIK